MNPYILEIAEEEKHIISELLSEEEKSLLELIKSPFLSIKERQAIANRLANITGLGYKVSEARPEIGQV